MKECPNIEFKETWSDDFLKWICGFANAQGGKQTLQYPYFKLNVLSS